MDSLGRTQRNGCVGLNRCKSAPSENIEEESTSCGEMMVCPEKSSPSIDDSLIKEAKMYVGRFFYENGLDFGAVNSPNFKGMVLSTRVMKCQVPSVEELKGWIFKEVMKEMHERVDEIRKSWAETGCSVLLDGWKGANGRSLVNVLVDCRKGTVYLRSFDVSDCVGSTEAMQAFFVKVLAEVGIHNVVQIVAYSHSAFMKEAGRLLMEEYRSIFWTVSASYCIELMLEKIRRMDIVNETLEKAKIITRFFHSHPIALKFLQEQTNGDELVDSSRIRSIRPFLTLEKIVMEKEILKAMFMSSHSRNSTSISDSEGRRVAELVADRSFWNGASTVLSGAIPLVRVIEWMNESQKDHMAYIYETVDQAKETIKKEFKSKKSSYLPFWKVIDDVWNECLYSPLHSTGYYLNPKLFYSSDIFIDPEVVTGLFCCFVRSATDLRMQDRMVVQLEQYRTAKGAMAAGVVEEQRSSLSPARWWSMYGGECPDLQRLAVRILSQTCDGAARFRLRRSLAETLLSKKRKESDEKWVRDMVFLRYNMQLQNFVPGETSHVVSDDDGCFGDESTNDDASWMEMDSGA